MKRYAIEATRRASRIYCLAASLIVGLSLRADIVVPGATGFDDVFSPTTDTTIDLNLASFKDWDEPGQNNGWGVYDESKWAIVFKYRSVNIPKGVTVRFINNAKGNPPVMWLVSEEIIVEGVIDISGGGEQGSTKFSVPGPGGFRGGIASRGTGVPLGSSGFGIGGGDENILADAQSWATGGSFGTRPSNRSGPSYGAFTLIPLMGGAGGGGDIGKISSSGGGAGGGAILLAASKRILLNGTIVSRGGKSTGGISGGTSGAGGSGSGGAIRLVSDRIEGQGQLDVRGGPVIPNTQGQHTLVEANGGDGRIRIEANSPVGSIAPLPGASYAQVGPQARLWPDATEPRVAIQAIGQQIAPASPNGGNISDLSVGTTDGLNTVTVEAFNVKTNASVKLRVTPFTGPHKELNCDYKSGDTTHSFWEATVPLSPGQVSLQVRAVTP